MFPGFYRALFQGSRNCTDSSCEVSVIETIGERVDGNWNRCRAIKLIERDVVLVDKLIV